MATQYIHFTEEQKHMARQTDIAELLRRQGQTLKRSGSEYEWKDGSAKVTIRGKTMRAAMPLTLCAASWARAIRRRLNFC